MVRRSTFSWPLLPFLIFVWAFRSFFVTNFDHRVGRDTRSLTDGGAIPYEEPVKQWEDGMSPLDMPKKKFLKDFRNPCYIDDKEVLTCLPYFMIVGFQKCGTTDLFIMMAQHPHIDYPYMKEPYWWTEGRLGGMSWNQYTDNFKYSSRRIQTLPQQRENGTYYHVITGEASVGYAWDNYEWRGEPRNANKTEPEVITPNYIHHILPEARIIMMVRHPTERLISSYKFFHPVNDKTPQEFHKLAVDGVNWLRKCYDEGHSRRHCIYDPPHDKVPAKFFRRRWGFYDPVAVVRTGLYSEYLDDWKNIYSKERIHFVKFEDYKEDRVQVLQDVYKYLELDPLPEQGQAKMKKVGILNKTMRRGTIMLNSTIQLLDEFYEPYVIKLAKELNDPNFCWDYKNCLKLFPNANS